MTRSLLMAKYPKGRSRPFFQESKLAPEVIAHRGGGGEWPGETIYAFEQAVQIGVDVLEMDIRYTADDRLVLMHNANLKETTGVDKAVKDLSYEEVKELDAAFWWRQAGKVFPPEADAKLKVPGLEDVFKAEALRGVRMNIEIKGFTFPEHLIKEFCRLLREYVVTDKVLVASAWTKHLRRFRRLCPEAATSASVLEMQAFRVLKSFRYRPDADAMQTMSKLSHVERINREFLDRAREVNLPVHGWTVNKPEEMGRLISLGIDGIITDYPSALLRFLGRLP